MTSLIRTLTELDGVASIGALKQHGVGEGVVRGALKSGLIQSVRKGWIAIPDAAPVVIRAVSLGGRLGCISAARHLGLWVYEPDDRLHVAVPRHSGHSVAHRETDVVTHWQSEPWRRNARAVDTVASIVTQLADCVSSETAVAIIDSALNQKRITFSEVAGLLGPGTLAHAELLDLIDAKSQSGLESLCRVRLLRSGYRVRSQVEIAGVGAVDLLVGDRLVIETDGREWHSSKEDFLRDRQRDVRLALLGYRALRLSYDQVIFEWPLVELSIRQLVARGEHLWR